MMRPLAILTAAMLAAACIGATPAGSHGKYDWIRTNGFTNAQGVHCCGKQDCAEIPTEMALTLQMGQTLSYQFPFGERSVTIEKIYGTLDPQNHSWICYLGCLFVPAMG